MSKRRLIQSSSTGNSSGGSGGAPDGVVLRSAKVVQSKLALSSLEELLKCPICFEIFQHPHVTRCGHAFCLHCILQAFEQSPECPKCAARIDDFTPCVVLEELSDYGKNMVGNLQKNVFSTAETPDKIREFKANFLEKFELLDLPDLQYFRDRIAQRIERFQQEQRDGADELLRFFLDTLFQKKQKELLTLSKVIAQTERDIHSLMSSPVEALNSDDDLTQQSSSTTAAATNQTSLALEQSSQSVQNSNSTSKHQCWLDRSKKQISENFDVLEKEYTNLQERTQFSGVKPEERLGVFKQDLVNFNKYTTLKPVTLVSVPKPDYVAQRIVSSIEFDRDAQYFAIAGIVKSIKIYEYSQVVKLSDFRKYPIKEIEASSKISCLSWNPYFKPLMAASGYNGMITVYDVIDSNPLVTFQEHQKRCWSVDFNKNDSKILASGSDDWTVKLWNINQQASLATIPVKANILSVQFNPKNVNHLAMGCADKKILYYDLRKLKKPLINFNVEHQRSVSYVKFLNETELISASTDNQIKLWNTNSQSSLRSFRSHLNEKRFVGLSTNEDFFCCGSEDNSVYVYYKGVERKTASFPFNKPNDFPDPNMLNIVSSVCWKPNSNVIIASSAKGNTKILELS